MAWYTPWSWGDDAAKGYNTAATGARTASTGFGELSDRLWQQQMEGLYGAMGQTNSSTGYASAMAGAPRGSMEDAWGYLSQQYQQPGQMSQSYQGLAGQYQQPSATSSTYGQGQQRLSGPTAQSSLYGSTQFGPTSSGQQYAQNAYQYQQPSGMQSFMGSTGSQLRAPGTYEQAAGGLASQAQRPSYLGGLYENNWGGYGTSGKTEGFQAKDVNYAQNYAQGANQRQAGPTATAQAAGGVGQYIQDAGFNGQEAGQLYRNAGMNDRAQGYYTGANQVQGFAGGLGKQFDEEGQYEKLANQLRTTGTNPMYERTKEKTAESINAQLAARGKFKSAAGVDRVGNAMAELKAQNFGNIMSAAQGAQGAKMSRLGQAQGLAEASSGERFRQGAGLQGLDQALSASRMGQAQGLHSLEGDRSRASLGQAGALMGLSGQLEGEFQGRENALARAAGMAGSEAMGNQQFGLQAAQASDNTRLARLAGMAGLAGAADTGNLSQINAASGILQGAQGMSQDRIGMLGGLTGQMDAGQLARLQGSQSAAGMTDSALMAQLGMQQNYAQGADSSNLAASLGLGTLAGQYDANTMARLGAQWGMSGDVDANSLQRLQGYGQSANLAQQAERMRMQDAYQALLSSDQMRAGLYSNAYGTAGQLYGDAQTNAWNALANSYALKGQGQSASAEVPFKLGGMIWEGGKDNGGRAANGGK